MVVVGRWVGCAMWWLGALATVRALLCASAAPSKCAAGVGPEWFSARVVHPPREQESKGGR